MTWIKCFDFLLAHRRHHGKIIIAGPAVVGVGTLQLVGTYPTRLEVHHVWYAIAIPAAAARVRLVT